VIRLALETPSVLDGAGQESRHLEGVWWLMVGLAAFVYVVVGGYVILAIRRRRHEDGPEEGPGRQTFLWFGGLALPISVLALLAGVTVATTVAVRRASEHEVRVDVVGRDWWWDVHYGGTNIRVANEIHLPVQRTAVLRLQSADVIHSFWVPQLAGKLDVEPGQPTTLRLLPKRTGTFIGECAEFCGIQHANMRFVVVVESRSRYDDWVRAKESATGADSGTAAEGAAVFQREACSGCHTVSGTQAAGTRGPDLTHVAERTWLGAGAITNTPTHLRQWIKDPTQFKPGVLMPPFTNLSDGDLRALVAYLETLR
jgi:cytochrome c oxidase subunit 2